jgi:2-succinyl-5-enolpyruvyl-6-hydroxy-3-cyclohexene-1-carboxylate synthase
MHKTYLENAPFSDLKVFETILEKLPKKIQLQISNSSPIRYAQLFPVDKSIEVYCNRGTSGIDGSTTTAIGASVISDKPVVFITGDISFFYDSNALWNNYIPQNFKIILINNSGGGIFRILPGHQETETFTTYFETSHQLTAEHLAKMYGFNYITTKNSEDIVANWNFFESSEKPVILEIFTPEKENDKVLLNYFKSLK